jgi:hypothetical protein
VTLTRLLSCIRSDSDVPLTDCEVRGNPSTKYASVAVNDTQVSMVDCLIADNPNGHGLYLWGRSLARLEGCKFLHNGHDTLVQRDSILYTDTPAFSLSQGCLTCLSYQLGPILPLTSAPATKFSTGNEPGFVALQLVCL